MSDQENNNDGLPPRRLTIKQQKFTKELVKTGNGTEAVLKSYKTKSRRNAAMIASELVTKPHVASAIVELLDRMYPNGDEKAGSWLIQALDAPIVGSRDDDGKQAAITWNEKKGFIELYLKTKGYTGGSTTQSRTVKKPLKLPNS